MVHPRAVRTPVLASKKAIGIAALTCAVALAGCTRMNAENVTPSNVYRVNFGFGDYNYVSIFTDPENGCDYWMTDDGFLSPRMNADGSLHCHAAPKGAAQ